MGAVIIGFALVALFLAGAAYYIVMPYAFNLRAHFAASVTDPDALEFGETLYDIVGIFPLTLLGAVFLNSYQNSVRQSNNEAAFS